MAYCILLDVATAICHDYVVIAVIFAYTKFMLMILINLIGLLAIGFIIWWFWLT